MADGKTKLTETGAAALRAWATRNGVTLVQLGEVLGGHAMTARRAMTREGHLTLEQVGALVAYARGELTAEQLVGLARAPSIPVLPQRPGPVAAPRPPPAQEPAPAVAPAAGLEDERALVDEAMALFARQMREAASEGERRRCAELLVEHIAGKARQREERKEEPTRAADDALMRKLRLIEAQLTGRTIDSLEAEARGDYEGEGLA